MLTCFGTLFLQSSPFDKLIDELLEDLLELGVKLLGGLCGQSLHEGLGFLEYVPDGGEIELPFLCSFSTLYFFFAKGIIILNNLLFTSNKFHELSQSFKKFSFYFLKLLLT